MPLIINPADPQAVKLALRSAPSRVMKEITIDTEEGPISLVIRKPTAEAMSGLQDSWKARNLADFEGKPASTDAALRMNRELLALSLFLPQAVRQLFTPDELVGVAWVDDAMAEVLAVINTGKALESAKGN